jgi:beta-glucanase (GH16 family)
MMSSRIILTILFPAIICFINNKYSVSMQSFCDQKGWKIETEDNFNTGSLNLSKWTVSLGNKYTNSQFREAYGTPENVYIDNDKLVLRSQREQKDGFNFTSGAITSKNKILVGSPSRVCIAAKLPGLPGRADGMWPAHWMMPNDNSCWPDHGEIDIMEMINGDTLSHATYHWNKNVPKSNCSGDNTLLGDDKAVSDWNSNFHEYAVERGETYIAFFIDSELLINVTNRRTIKHLRKKPKVFPAVKYYIILNTAIGKPWAKEPTNSTIFPAYHIINYVKVAVPNYTKF